jgi:hypothetical protein
MKIEALDVHTRRLVVASTLIAGLLSLAWPAEDQAAPQCPLSHGYWKAHPEAWPVHTLVLGNSSPAHTYVQSDLLTLLATTTSSDASVSLARQLIAAKLNIANGSNAAPVASTLSGADALRDAQRKRRGSSFGRDVGDFC